MRQPKHTSGPLKNAIRTRVDFGFGETGIIIDAEMYDGEPDYLIRYDKPKSTGETSGWHRRDDFIPGDKDEGGAE